MLDVVHSIGGLHAQVMSSAELTLWARVEGLQPGDLSKALWEERKLVKTWAMRGTLHLLPADELPMWLAGFSTYDHYLKGAWFKAFGLTREELERLIDAVGEALDGEPLTRVELAEAVAAAIGDASLGEKLAESWGAVPQAGRFPGPALLRARQGPQRLLHPAGPLRRDARPGRAGCRRWPTITRRWLGRVRPGNARGPGALVGASERRARREDARRARRRGGRGRCRGQEAAHARRPTPRRPPRSRRSARPCSSPASTSGWWARPAARPRCSTPRRRRGSTARRAGSRRRCS